MKYPRMTKDQKKETGACKLNEEEITEIKERFKAGESKASLARAFGISGTAIHYWTNEEYRQGVLERTRIHNRELWGTDEGRRETHRRTQRIWMRRKRKELLFQKYLKEKCKERDKKREEIYRLWKEGKLVRMDYPTVVNKTYTLNQDTSLKISACGRCGGKIIKHKGKFYEGEMCEKCGWGWGGSL